MVASRAEGETYFHIDNENFNEELSKIICLFLPQFKKIKKKQINFNILFILIFFIEIVALGILSPFLLESFLFSFSLAGLFLSIFSYYSLKIYFQAQKSERYEKLILKYARSCKSVIKYREGIPEHHIALANAYTKLSSELCGFESELYQLPDWLSSMAPTVENLSTWSFFKDLFTIRESLLIEAIEEHIKLVKCEPTSLDIHAALANAHVTLSSLYLKTKKEGASQKNVSFEFEQDLDTKFRSTAEKAIEEFKILKDFAPNDPWVHAQLAYSYRDLKMPEEEIAEYETILKLRPDDTETLFKLGCLYFQQGRNSNGLRVYEKIKSANFKKAEQLISFYGAIHPSVLIAEF